MPLTRTDDSPPPSRPRGLKALGLKFLLLAPALAVAAVLLAGSAPTRSSAAPEATASVQLELKPTERHRRVAKLVAEQIEKFHYRQAAADEALSSQVFDHYLETLDGNRSYLLRSDLAEFERYRYTLADSIKNGAVEPAFVIFQRLQERNRAAMRGVIALLDTEPDFKLDEDFSFDRSKEPWCANQAELDELWRKRVKNDALSLMLTGKSWTDAREVLRKRYEHVLKRINQVSADDVFESFMNAYAHVFDPHSNYLNPRSSEEYNIQMRLSYIGIGASLQLIDDYVTIMGVLDGGPVAVKNQQKVNEQLKVNDRITAVGQGHVGELVDVVGWRLDDVVQLIRGPGGTSVRLSVLPAGATPGSKEAVLEYTRNKVTLDAQAAQKKVRTVQHGDQQYKVGVIDVPSFYQDYDARVAGDKDYRSTTRDVARLIEELKKEKIDGLVMDLRGNGGGHLLEATGLVGLFIKRGPVVQLRETSGRVEVYGDPDPAEVWDGPLVVLVDRSSASASEIFAAAIQDYGRGLVVGQTTYGKGTVQNLYPLDRFSLGPNAGFGDLTVTIAKYYRVTGDSVQNRGVLPEIALPSMISTTEVGESTRDSALPWDRIRSVSFDGDRSLMGAVPVLEKAHDQRLRSDPDLVALEGDVQAVESMRAEKTVSLNLVKRKAERERLDQERLARINARRAAHGEAALASLEKLDTEKEPDANLQETGAILADLIALKHAPAAQLSHSR
jgi:carboxyl-terminal processing protease